MTAGTAAELATGQRDFVAPARSIATRLTTPLVPAAIAALLGLIDIGGKSMWLDEAFSVSVARQPTLDLIPYLWHNELHGSPYYIALQPWLALGQTEVAVRALSVVFGVLAVLATYAVGKRFGVAFPAALVLAVSPFFIQFEQEAREYTLLVLFAALSTLAYLRLIERPGRLRALVYVAVAAAIIYVHPFGAFVVTAQAVAAASLAPREQRLGLLLLFGPIVVAWLPMVGYMLNHRDKIYWIPPLTPQLALDYLVMLGGGLVLALLAGVLLVLGARRDVITVWLIAPVIGALAVAILLQPFIQPRYLICVLPAAAIIVARSRPILITAVVALSLVGVAGWYATPPHEDWRDGAAWIAQQALPTDGVVFAPAYMRLPFDFYAQVGEPLYPDRPWDQLYVYNVGTAADIPGIAAHQRIWLIAGHGHDLPPDVSNALAPFAVTMVRDFGGDGPYVELLIRSV